MAGDSSRRAARDGRHRGGRPGLCRRDLADGRTRHDNGAGHDGCSSASHRDFKGYYDDGSNQLSDWSRYRRYGFNLILAGINTRLLHRLTADGASAWVQPNVWTGCGYKLSTSEALGRARRTVATGAVSGFYVADEPSASGCSSAPAQIAAWTAILHAHFPRIPTIIATYDSTDLTDFAHSADEFALDFDPCQYGNGCDYSGITELAATADRLGLRYVGVPQAFGDDGHYDLPTPSQLRQIIRTWQATEELGYVVYAFSAVGMPSSTWLQTIRLCLRSSLPTSQGQSHTIQMSASMLSRYSLGTCVLLGLGLLLLGARPAFSQKAPQVKVGTVLKANLPAPVFHRRHTLQWERCRHASCRKITGATAGRYRTRNADAGHGIDLKVAEWVNGRKHTLTMLIATSVVSATASARATRRIKGYYDQGSDQLGDWSRYKRYGFNLVFAGINPKLLDRLRANGASAWVQPNIWTGCGYE